MNVSESERDQLCRCIAYIVSITLDLTPAERHLIDAAFYNALLVIANRCPSAPAAAEEDDYCELRAAEPGILEKD